MRYVFKRSIARALALLGLLGLGFVQVGCAHSVVVEPSVVIHSRVGHVPVYAQVGAPGQVVVLPPPRVIYAPPPRVVYVPRVDAPVYGWGHGPLHGWARGHDGRYDRHDRQHDLGRWGQDHRQPAHNQGGRYQRGDGNR